MNLSFKSRIALHYMVATATVMAITFMVIYFVVQKTVMANLDSNLLFEAHKHLTEIKIEKDSILFINKKEWEEREHREVQVNPVFIQLNNKDGQVMDKSPNLKDDFLFFNELGSDNYFNTEISRRAIRQIQLPIKQNNLTKGYILAALPSEYAILILSKLKTILFVSYLVILIGLFFISRFLAGKSIRPVQEVTNTITRISKYNLKERVVLPQHKDEIYDLSVAFNSLLSNIEKVLEREKQFTSDASHELRTPLATLRGTLEILIRKPRERIEYESKIQLSLIEIEKMTKTLEQLLVLARLDGNSISKGKNPIPLPTILDESLDYHKQQIVNKNLRIDFRFDTEANLMVPPYYTNLIINNIISNAIKYSRSNTTLKITLKEDNKQVTCIIEDEGLGIKKEDLNQIYDNFFRSDALNHKQIKGTGLGLSIVKKAAEAIGTEINIQSTQQKGTSVHIIF